MTGVLLLVAVFAACAVTATIRGTTPARTTDPAGATLRRVWSRAATTDYPRRRP